MRVCTFVFALTLTALGASSWASAEPEAIVKKSQTGIQWKVAPAAVIVYLDGKKLGQASTLDITETKAGMHQIRLVNGEDETEFDVKVATGQVLTVTYEFTDE